MLDTPKSIRVWRAILLASSAATMILLAVALTACASLTECRADAHCRQQLRQRLDTAAAISRRNEAHMAEDSAPTYAPMRSASDGIVANALARTAADAPRHGVSTRIESTKPDADPLAAAHAGGAIGDCPLKSFDECAGSLQWAEYAAAMQAKRQQQ